MGYLIKNRIQQFFPIFLLLILSLPVCLAQNGTFNEVKDVNAFQTKMLDISNSTKTISSSFVQEKHLSFMEEAIVSKGDFFYKKDQKIRWEYKNPYQYLVILNGSELLINDEGHTNEIDLKGNKTYQEINKTISNSLQGNVWQGQKDFAPVLKENDQQYLISLSPQTTQMKEYLTGIEVFFDKKSYLLTKVIMREPGNDWTQITFTNQKINQEIGEEQFRL